MTDLTESSAARQPGRPQRAVDSCTLTNIGSYDGTEAVQLYLADPVSEVTRPVQELSARPALSWRPENPARWTSRWMRTARPSLVWAWSAVTPGLVQVLGAISSTKVDFTHELILHGPRKRGGFRPPAPGPSRGQSLP